MARYSGSSPGGGAAGVLTVNGVPPDGGGDVTLVASDIPTTGPSNAQADLDLLFSATATGVKTFESWDEFTAFAVEAPAGTWTFDQPLIGAGMISMPAGAKIVGGESAAVGAAVPGSLTFLADVDAAVLTGPLQMRDVIVEQQNAGASAIGIDLISTAGSIPFLQSVQVFGGRVGYRVSSVVGPATIQGSLSANADTGFQVSGAVDAVLFAGCSTANTMIGFEVTAAASTVGGFVIQDPSIVLSPGQFGIAIAHAATFTTPALVQISGASNTGSQAAMFRQTAPGVTDMAIDDNRLVIKGGPSVANWAAQVVVSRFVDGDPLIVDNSSAGAGVSVVIPYEDGAGNVEIVASLESHFTFFKDGGDPLNWYFEYTAPTSDATIRLASDALAERANVGPSTAILCWERAPFIGPGHGAFVAVPDSDVPWQNTNSLTPRSGIATFNGVNQFDRFRVVISDSSSTDVELVEIKLDLSINS